MIDETWLDAAAAQFRVTDDALRQGMLRFEGEMALGLRQPAASSLYMEPCYVELPTGREHGRAVALDFGGTNARAVLVELAADGCHVRGEVRRPLLVGGGVGVPPLYNLARKLLAEGREVQVVLGFNTASECFYEEEFRALGCRVTVATADGSHGVRGFVTTAIAERHPDFDYFYACGPLPMLRALAEAVEQDGQLSFEERMGCGFGACMGCSCKTKYGNKRICKEGPVLEKGEVIW